MSKPSKSSSQVKNSSSVGSVCPPTARSMSLLTAEPPSQLIPTAMSNSVNTAIGATPSEFESSSGLSDTSAGSGRVSSAATTPKTAQAPTSPEMLMNDLRRGSLFGRQSLSQSQETREELPNSITNVTFSGTTATNQGTFDLSTADQLSMKSGTISESTKTGIPMSGKSGSGGADKSRRRSPAVRISQLKLKEEKQKQLESTSPMFLSKKSKKSKKSRKSKKSAKKLKKTSEDSGKSMKTGISQKSTKSGKVGKKKAAEGGFSMDADFSKKSAKSKKSIKKSDKPPQFGQSGVVKKGDNSTYLTGVMNGAPPANKFMKREGAESQKVQKPRKFNDTPVYNFPGTGKCTRSMDQVAPPTSQNAQNQNHVVYDVTQLPEAQRRVPGKPFAASKCDGRHPMKKKSLFGEKSHYSKGPINPSASRKSLAPAAPTRIQAPTENKIVVFGKTPDGKTTVQMTIDMKIIAGEALNGSDKPATLIPKKVIVGGKEIKIDSESKSESGESP